MENKKTPYKVSAYGWILNNKVASQKRFELLTHALEGRCSIQLSYWDTYGAGDGNRTHVASLEG